MSVTSKPGSKYAALHDHLRRRAEERVELSLAEIEALLGEPLPESARKGTAFWSNRQGGLQSAAWLGAGYRVTHVDLDRRRVRFERRKRSSARLSAGGGRWDGEMVRTLRDRLGLSQAALAELLGVRQQTISEWETGTYAPTRASSKHLDLVAERSGIAYGGRQKRPIDKTSDTV